MCSIMPFALSPLQFALLLGKNYEIRPGVGESNPNSMKNLLMNYKKMKVCSILVHLYFVPDFFYCLVFTCLVLVA
jgi:hypothetical protein